MKQEYAAYEAIIADLRQREAEANRISDVGEAKRTEVAGLSLQLKDAEASLVATEKRHILDQADINEVTTARRRVHDLREKHAEAERLAELADEAYLEANTKMADVRNAVQGAHTKYCIAVMTNIFNTLNADKKIRTQLLEAYAAMASSGVGYNGTWSLFLEKVFARATHEEITANISEFMTKHRLA